LRLTEQFYRLAPSYLSLQNADRQMPEPYSKPLIYWQSKCQKTVTPRRNYKAERGKGFNSPSPSSDFFTIYRHVGSSFT
jgi:hypothetical protein